MKRLAYQITYLMNHDSVMNLQYRSKKCVKMHIEEEKNMKNA